MYASPVNFRSKKNSLYKSHLVLLFPFVFDYTGAGNVLWVITWFVFTADTPVQSKRIKPLERDYILDSIGERPDTKVPERMLF